MKSVCRYYDHRQSFTICYRIEALNPIRANYEADAVTADSRILRGVHSPTEAACYAGCLSVLATPLQELLNLPIQSYDEIVRLLSPEPFGWLPPRKSTRAWEPTLLWNQYHSSGSQ
jgi:hypothetical protein